MTRKEELERIAESEALCAENRNCAEIKEAFLYRLLQVEQEVWEKAAKELEDVNFYAAAWCREQRKEVS